MYSLLFRDNNHPIPALLTQTTGIEPPSKGLSASFSELIRGNIDAAYKYNPHGLRVFSFFAFQMLLRIFFSLLLLLRKGRVLSVVIIDSTLSIVLFLWSFWPMIVFTFRVALSVAQNLI